MSDSGEEFDYGREFRRVYRKKYSSMSKRCTMVSEKDRKEIFVIISHSFCKHFDMLLSKEEIDFNIENVIKPIFDDETQHLIAEAKLLERDIQKEIDRISELTSWEVYDKEYFKKNFVSNLIDITFLPKYHEYNDLHNRKWKEGRKQDRERIEKEKEEEKEEEKNKPFCKYCRERGHVINYCPKIFCNNCAKKGHTHWVCQKKNKK